MGCDSLSYAMNVLAVLARGFWFVSFLPRIVDDPFDYSGMKLPQWRNLPDIV